MFEHEKEGINRFSQDIRRDLLEAGLRAAERRFDAPIRRYEKKRRCMEMIGKVVCVLLVVVSALLVIDYVCKKCGIKRIGEKKVTAIEDEHKELYQKLAKIKGRNA